MIAFLSPPVKTYFIFYVCFDENRSVVMGRRNVGRFQSGIFNVILFAFCCGSAFSNTYYVDANNATPSAPYTSWATAATNIQAAVNQAVSGDTVLVADGQYILSSEILVSEDITLRSLNGPSQTRLDGGQSVRCVNMGSTISALEGFEVTRGKVDLGGGIYCSSTTPTISNCWITANESTQYGGGVHMGTVKKSRIYGNKATNRGGGASESVLFDCEVSGNSITFFMGGAGGGLYGGSAYQCLIISNYSTGSGGGTHSSTLRHCVVAKNNCRDTYSGTGMNGGAAYNSIIYNNGTSGYAYKRTSLYYSCIEHIIGGTGGIGIVEADPSFVDPANGDYRLSDTSPCINVADPDIPFWAEDYYGNDRVQKLIPDMGIYESAIASPDPLYVSELTGNDLNDGTSWATAKKTIHAAEAAHQLFGGSIIIGDGTYLLSSEIKPTRELTFKSLNGPESTIVDGNMAVRCFNFSGTDSVAVGLTIQGGALFSPNNGGACVNAGTISNCIVRGASPRSYGGSIYRTMAFDSIIEDSYECGASESELFGCLVRGNQEGGIISGTAVDCTFSNNYGAGVISSSVTNCLLIGNSGRGASNASLYECRILGNKGGASGGRLVNCQILDNSVPSGHGGGMSGGSMSNCVVRGNSASGNGGGVYGVVVDRCIISNNSAREGGGAYNGTLRGSAIFDNLAGMYGGGASQADMIHCTVVGNHAEWNGGGAYFGVISNSIVYYNTSLFGQNNLRSADVYSSCSSDVFHGAEGNITNQPMLISSSHIAQTSPCRGAVSSAGMMCPDVDGEPWGIPSSMGCDEFDISSEHRGNIQVALSGPNQVVAGYACRYEVDVEGNVINRVIDFGDGTNSEYGTLVPKIWSAPGEYSMTVKVYNDDFPAGISTNLTVQVLSREEVSIYVKEEGGNDANDGRSWGTAKATIQAGVDTQNIEGGVVVLSSGTHMLSSEVVVDKNVQITSEPGLSAAIVDGGESSRCFNLGTSFSILDGLWITKGSSDNGGGIYCENINPLITNCVVTGNHSSSYAGGVHGGTLTHCLIEQNNSGSYAGGVGSGIIKHSLVKGNRSMQGGGGTSGCTIFNSKIFGNIGVLSGGVEGGIAHNCIIRGNSASSSSSGIGGGARSATLYNCLVIGNSGLYEGGIRGGTAINCISINNQGSSSQSNYINVNTHHCCGPDLTHGVDGNITNAPVFIDELNEDYHLVSGSPGIDDGMEDAFIRRKDMDSRPRVAGAHIDMGPYEWSRDILRLNIDGNQVQLTWIPVSGTRVYDVLWSPDLALEGFVEIQTGIAYPQCNFSDNLDVRGHKGFYKLRLRPSE